MPIVISDETIEFEDGKVDFGADIKNLTDLCQRIHTQLIDVSARISVIEETMLNNASISKDRQPNLVKKIEDNRVFTIANHLPLRNIQDLKAFEDNLKNAGFKDTAVIYETKFIPINFYLHI